MAYDAIKIGAQPDDGTGDSARAAGQKLNAMLQQLYAGVPHARLDVVAAAFSASFRDDGAGNFGWYVGAAGAADGAQVKVATVDKTTGNVGFTNWLGVGTSSPQAPLHVAGAIRAGAVSGANAAIALYGDGATATIEGFEAGNAGNKRPIGLNPYGGNVGIGTTAPGKKLHVLGAGFDGGSGYFQSSDSANSLSIVGVNGAGIYDTAFLSLQDGGGSSFIARTGTMSTAGDFRIVHGGSERLRITAAGHILPGGAGTQNFGSASLPIANSFFAVSPTITSDARVKLDADGNEISEATGWAVTPASEAELRVARRLAAALGFYKFKDAVAAKGFAAARRHFGLTVQFALMVCDEEGVDPWSIGIFCRDEITRKVKVMRTVIEQKTGEVEEAYAEIEIRDGVPVRVQKTRAVQRPMFEMVAVVDEAGRPVMQEVQPDGLGFGGIPETKPLLHPVPVMIEREREVEVDEPPGDRLGFRYDQLNMFMLRGLAAGFEAREA